MNTRDIAKAVLTKMLPTPNRRGVDIDDPYYDQLVKEASQENGVDTEDLEMEIRSILGEVAQFGFAVLD